MELLKQAGFATLHNVSRKTVTKWKERGWLVFEGDLVDVEASNALLKKYRSAGIDDVTQTAKGNKGGNKASAKPVAVTQAIEGDDETASAAVERFIEANGAPWDMDEARRVKENYLAMLNQLEYDTKSGKVVLAAEVAEIVGSEYAKVRTRLLAMPAEHAPRIQRLRTVTEVQDALQELITEALEELTRDGGN